MNEENPTQETIQSVPTARLGKTDSNTESMSLPAMILPSMRCVNTL
jgi:hypothetical protein